jgi:hypothetical protein
LREKVKSTEGVSPVRVVFGRTDDRARSGILADNSLQIAQHGIVLVGDAGMKSVVGGREKELKHLLSRKISAELDKFVRCYARFN